MAETNKAQVTRWRAICAAPNCSYVYPDWDRQVAEAMAVLHQMGTGHRVLLIGAVETSPVKEVSGIEERT